MIGPIVTATDPYTRLALTLLKELRLRLVRSQVRLVGTPLAVEVDVGVPSRGRRIVLAGSW